MGENFNDNLKTARERKGLSQNEVAEKIGVAKSTYSLYESGNREPNVQTIKKISDVLSVSADTLLGLDDEQPINTIVAHFDGTEFTDTELDDIANYIEFVKSKKS
jgi:transcriptional regulator with XRE-family HTH domain